MTDHLTPERIATATAQAQERHAEQLGQEREQRQQQRTYRSKAREVHDRWSKREQRREARAYAERWWQDLRLWETRQAHELVPRTSSGSGGAGSMVAIVGNYGRGQSRLDYSQVLTPMGWVSESALGRAISESGCQALERVRNGGSLNSLLRQGYGWADGAQEVAKAVLELAKQLGDEAARLHIFHL